MCVFQHNTAGLGRACLNVVVCAGLLDDLAIIPGALASAYSCLCFLFLPPSPEALAWPAMARPRSQVAWVWEEHTLAALGSVCLIAALMSSRLVPHAHSVGRANWQSKLQHALVTPALGNSNGTIAAAQFKVSSFSLSRRPFRILKGCKFPVNGSRHCRH
jgi:hypothetical protein